MSFGIIHGASLNFEINHGLLDHPWALGASPAFVCSGCRLMGKFLQDGCAAS